MDDGPVSIVRSCGIIDSEANLADTMKELGDATVVGLYHTASWCPPCRKFTPTLHAFAEKNPRFKVVVVSGDKNEFDFKNYIAKYPGFLSIPFESPARGAVVQAMNSTMMPNLHIYNVRNGELLTTWGRTVISENPDAMEMWSQGESGMFHGKVIGRYVFGLSAMVLVLIFLFQNILPSRQVSKGL